MAIKQLQTNFTSGVIDPKLVAREDIVFYYNGLKTANNLLVMPQGGVRTRPGMQFVREVAKQLSDVSLAAAVLSAPHGGTTGNAIDGDDATVLTTTDNLSNTNPFVILHISLPGASAISAIDTINYKLSAGVLTGEIRWQSSPDDVNWTDYGTAFNWDATLRTRRVRSDVTNNNRYWRLVRIGATAIAGTASLARVRFMAQAEALSETRLLSFAYSTDEAYMMVVSDRNVDVMVGREHTGSISIPHLSADLALIKKTQNRDTMLIFHRGYQTLKVFRQGGDDEFDSRNYVYKNIPKYDFGAGVGGVDEVQLISDGGTLASGDKFSLLLEGQRTATVTGGASRAASATAIETALRALSNTSATGITVADAGGNGFNVMFSGDDGKQEWSDLSISVLTGNSVWSVSKPTKGQPQGEDIMSDARGWPRCGTYHQSRLNVCGMPGVPDSWLASAVGEYDNFDINRDDVTKALLNRADTDQVNAIYDIVAGRNLSFFSNDGELYIPAEKIDEEAVLKSTTDCGSKEGLSVFRVEGALVFFQGVKDEESGREIATSLQEFIFEETQQAYKSNLISKLSSHLIKNPVDADLHKALSTDDANILLIVNEDGTGTAYTVLRDDAVNAFMPINLRAGDKLKSVGVDKKRRVYFISERVINGIPRRFLEMWNKDLFLDCGDIVTVTANEVAATVKGQASFVWVFENPADPDAIGVRLNGGRLDGDEYEINLGTKTITLSADRAAEVVQGSTIRISRMVNEISSLDHLEGETVRTFIDGTEGGDFTIAGGVLTLDDYADTEIQYGFDFEVSGSLMPFRIPQTETLAAQKIRVVDVILNLYETSGISIRANNGGWQEARLVKTDDEILDRSTMDLLFTGEYKFEGLAGYAVGGPVEFRRPGPGPFTLLGITRKVSI